MAETLLLRVGRELGRPGLSLDDSALELVIQGDWPGNVRQLVNALERAAILADDTVLSAHHFAFPDRLPAAGKTVQTLAEIECAAIEQALADVDGNRRRAAARLGLGLRTLYDKLKRYELD